MRNNASVTAICLPRFSPKAKTNRTFCFNCSIGQLREDLRTCYFCRRYKFSIKSMLCNLQYFCVVDSDLLLNNIENALLHFHLNNGYAKPDTMLRSTYVACLVLCYLVRTFNIIAQCEFMSMCFNYTSINFVLLILLCVVPVLKTTVIP